MHYYMMTLSPREDETRTHHEFALLYTNMKKLVSIVNKYMGGDNVKKYVWMQEEGKNHPHLHAFYVTAKPVSVTNVKKRVVGRMNKGMLNANPIPPDNDRWLDVKKCKKGTEDTSLGYVCKSHDVPVMVEGITAEECEAAVEAYRKYKLDKETPHSKCGETNKAYEMYLKFLIENYKELDYRCMEEQIFHKKRYVEEQHENKWKVTRSYTVNALHEKYFFKWRMSVSNKLTYLCWAKCEEQKFSTKGYEDVSKTELVLHEHKNTENGFF